MYHAKNGLYFDVLPHGDLYVVVKDDNENVKFEVTLLRSMVASVMATACKRGYTTETFYEAYEYLQNPGTEPKVN